MERLGSNSWCATSERKAAHCGSEANNGLRKKQLTPFGEDEHRKLGQLMEDGTGRCCNKCVEIEALKCLGFVPIYNEKARVAVKEP